MCSNAPIAADADGSLRTKSDRWCSTSTACRAASITSWRAGARAAASLRLKRVRQALLAGQVLAQRRPDHVGDVIEDRLSRLGGRAWRDEAGRQGHAACFRAAMA